MKLRDRIRRTEKIKKKKSALKSLKGFLRGFRMLFSNNTAVWILIATSFRSF